MGSVARLLEEPGPSGLIEIVSGPAAAPDRQTHTPGRSPTGVVTTG